MHSISFFITGFHCEACVKLTTSRIRKISGVSNVHVEPDGSTVVQAEREIPLAEFQTALEGTDYKITQ